MLIFKLYQIWRNWAIYWVLLRYSILWIKLYLRNLDKLVLTMESLLQAAIVDIVCHQHLLHLPIIISKQRKHIMGGTHPSQPPHLLLKRFLPNFAHFFESLHHHNMPICKRTMYDYPNLPAPNTWAKELNKSCNSKLASLPIPTNVRLSRLGYLVGFFSLAW